MREADVSIDRDAAISHDMPRGGFGSNARATPRAALCGARPFSSADAPAGEASAATEVESDTVGPLSARQSRVAHMLATGMSVREVAATLGIHRGTIFRWRQSNVAFRREQRRHAAEEAGELSCIARRLLVKATGYVDRLMEDEGSRGEWAARILRNPKLWDLASAVGEEPGDDSDG